LRKRRKGKRGRRDLFSLLTLKVTAGSRNRARPVSIFAEWVAYYALELDPDLVGACAAADQA
jgi:hypothetical protein